MELEDAADQGPENGTRLPGQAVYGFPSAT